MIDFPCATHGEHGGTSFFCRDLTKNQIQHHRCFHAVSGEPKRMPKCEGEAKLGHQPWQKMARGAIVFFGGRRCCFCQSLTCLSGDDFFVFRFLQQFEVKVYHIYPFCISG